MASEWIDSMHHSLRICSLGESQCQLWALNGTRSRAHGISGPQSGSFRLQGFKNLLSMTDLGNDMHTNMSNPRAIICLKSSSNEFVVCCWRASTHHISEADSSASSTIMLPPGHPQRLFFCSRCRGLVRTPLVIPFLRGV